MFFATTIPGRVELDITLRLLAGGQAAGGDKKIRYH